MPRRPGPQPKDASQRRRRNVDPVVGRDGVAKIDPSPVVDAAPGLPEWCDVSGRTLAFYRELCRLPQRRVWTDGDWLALWSALPLVDRYLTRPGSESFKAWTSALFPALRITSDDLVKARVKISEPDEVETPPEVAVMDAYRKAAGG